MNTSLLLSPVRKEPTNQVDGNIPYEIGDVITIRGHQYEFVSSSMFGDTIDFRYLGYNKRPEGFTEGSYAPKVYAKTINNNDFRVSDFKGKYLLLDFWGTWCNPCLKAIPELNALNEKFKAKNFALVSIANDKDINAVKSYISKYQMNWLNVFQNEITGSRETDLIKKFKISSYPTTILIDPDGKIISRNRSIQEIEKILNEKLN